MISSSTFGQINFPSSRVDGVDHDDNDGKIDDEKRTYSRHFEGTGKLLFVTTCNLSGDFASVYLLDNNSELLGHISEITEFSEEESKPKQTRRAARFFHADEGIVVCKVDIQVDNGDTSSLSSEILGLPFDNVVVLTSNHIAAFKTSNPENAAPLTRCLSSAQWIEGMPAKQLDRPNVVGGLPGAVLSMCEFSGRPALLIVNYSDSLETDSTSLSGFSPVYEVAGIRLRNAFLPRPNAKERLEQLCESRYGNLYM